MLEEWFSLTVFHRKLLVLVVYNPLFKYVISTITKSEIFLLTFYEI